LVIEGAYSSKESHIKPQIQKARSEYRKEYLAKNYNGKRHFVLSMLILSYSTFIGHTCQMTMTITSPSGIVLSQAKSDPVLSGLGGIDISQTIRRLKNCD
jgi:hypothetical protein